MCTSPGKSLRVWNRVEFGLSWDRCRGGGCKGLFQAQLQLLVLCFKAVNCLASRRPSSAFPVGLPQALLLQESRERLPGSGLLRGEADPRPS